MRELELAGFLGLVDGDLECELAALVCEGVAVSLMLELWLGGDVREGEFACLFRRRGDLLLEGEGGGDAGGDGVDGGLRWLVVVEGEDDVDWLIGGR